MKKNKTKVKTEKVLVISVLLAALIVAGGTLHGLHQRMR